MRVCAQIGVHPIGHWSAFALLLASFAPGLAAASGATRSALPAGAGYTESGSTRALVCIGQPLGGGAGAAGQRGAWAGLLVGIDFGAPAVAGLSEGVGGIAGALRLDLDEAVAGATLRYRRGGEIGYANLAMQPADAGARSWTATLPAAALGVRGIQYYLDIADPPFSLRVPAGAPAGGLESFAIAVADHEAFALGELPRDYFLGLPLAPASGDPQLLFGEALGAYGAPRWRLYTYDPAAAAYAEAPAAMPLVSGRGFWLSAGEAAFVAIDGSALDLGADVQLALAPGWNAIANPFAFPLPITALRFGDGRARNLYAYRPSALADYDDAAGGALTALAPGEGYWVENEGATPLALAMPASPHEAPPAAALPAPGLAAGEAGWSLQLRATTGRVGAARARCGQRLGAGPGPDPFDYGEPPSPPQGYLSLAWLDAAGRRLATDYRALATAGERWTLRLDSDQGGADYRVDCTLTGALPPGWALVAIEAGTLIEQDLLELPRLAGRLAQRAPARSWHLLAGDAAYLAAARAAIAGEFAAGLDGFALWPAYPNPGGRATGTLLAVAAPRAGALVLRIYDVQGRLVRRLHDGPVAPGLARFTWRGESEGGEPVAAGVYFVRAEAPGLVAVRKLVWLH
jgi:hypothetical protein